MDSSRPAVYHQEEISEISFNSWHRFLSGINADNDSGNIYKSTFSPDTSIFAMERSPNT